MVITKDFLLRGPTWGNTIDRLAPIFRTRTNYEIFMLCLAIGIMYDKRIPSFDDGENEPRNVPRNIIQNNDNGRIDLMLQAAILTTSSFNHMTEDQRLDLAFGENKNEEGFDKHDFLLSFANYGVTKLAECVGVNEFESMELIKNFLTKTLEGNNFEIDALPDELLLEDEEY